jgi:single-stranded-DNA-specific exonuclease
VKDYLDLAALGTIADLVPLRAESRILAAHGLKALGEARRQGLRAFIAVSGMEPGGVLSSVDVSYRIGPRINASGRLADVRSRCVSCSPTIRPTACATRRRARRDRPRASGRSTRRSPKKPWPRPRRWAISRGYVVARRLAPRRGGHRGGQDLPRAGPPGHGPRQGRGERQGVPGRSVPGTNLVEALGACADLPSRPSAVIRWRSASRSTSPRSRPSAPGSPRPSGPSVSPAPCKRTDVTSTSPIGSDRPT